jgi:hypothetical protein
MPCCVQYGITLYSCTLPSTRLHCPLLVYRLLIHSTHLSTRVLSTPLYSYALYSSTFRYCSVSLQVPRGPCSSRPRQRRRAVLDRRATPQSTHVGTYQVLLCRCNMLHHSACLRARHVQPARSSRDTRASGLSSEHAALHGQGVCFIQGACV